jgi:hypothetical protein
MPTIPEYVQAINDASGLITVAARRLNVDRTAIYKARQKHPQIAQAIEDARERMTDLAEGKLYSKINEGDMTAIIFYLKTQGKKRGYVERQEIEAQVTQGRFILNLVDDDGNSN